MEIEKKRPENPIAISCLIASNFILGLVSMVELSGIEPLTSSLRTRRSPN
jgi:hypothetical protein